MDLCSPNISSCEAMYRTLKHVDNRHFKAIFTMFILKMTFSLLLNIPLTVSYFYTNTTN
jgi:hypothetical protein